MMILKQVCRCHYSIHVPTSTVFSLFSCCCMHLVYFDWTFIFVSTKCSVFGDTGSKPWTELSNFHYMTTTFLLFWFFIVLQTLYLCWIVPVAEDGFDEVEPAISNGIRLLSVPIQNKTKQSGAMDSAGHLKSHPSSSTFPLSGCSDCFEASSSSKQDCIMLNQTSTGDHVQRSLNSVISSLDDMPHNLNVNLRVARLYLSSILWLERWSCAEDLILMLLLWMSLSRHTLL